MRVTINEAEMKQAITNHIGEMMNLAEGCEIDIDLKATRGNEGWTAEIDITRPSTNSPLRIKDKVEDARKAPVTAQELVEDPAPTEPAEVVDDASEVDAESPAEPTEEDLATVGDEPKQAEKKTSLFADLGRPKNEKN